MHPQASGARLQLRHGAEVGAWRGSSSATCARPSARWSRSRTSQLDDRGRRVRGVRRPLGLRQDHDLAHDRRLRGPDRGRDPHRRPRGQRPRAARPRASAWCSRPTRCFRTRRVAQNIEFGLRMKKVPPRGAGEARARGRRHGAHRAICSTRCRRQCSGGESQRVALARTLVTNPSTFLLDEPLSSLDAKLRRELRAECDRLHEELKRTFIFVTHDQEEAMTLADRIVVMRNGEIEQIGSPMEIYSDPVSYFVADFFGSPSMNLVAGEISHGGGAPRFRSAAASRSRCRSALRAAAPGRGDARHPARARRRPRPAAAATSRCRCAWSSRSARTRCSISTTARARLHRGQRRAGDGRDCSPARRSACTLAAGQASLLFAPGRPPHRR